MLGLLAASKSEQIKVLCGCEGWPLPQWASPLLILEPRLLLPPGGMLHMHVVNGLLWACSFPPYHRYAYDLNNGETIRSLQTSSTNYLFHAQNSSWGTDRNLGPTEPLDSFPVDMAPTLLSSRYLIVLYLCAHNTVISKSVARTDLSFQHQSQSWTDRQTWCQVHLSSGSQTPYQRENHNQFEWIWTE